MDLTALAILIMAIAVVALVVALIPTIQQLKKTLASVETTMNEEVKPLVRSINETVSEAKGVVKLAGEGVQKVDDALEAVRELGGTVRGINELVDKKVKGTLIEAISYLVGVKVGLGTLVDAVKPHRKKEVA